MPTKYTLPDFIREPGDVYRSKRGEYLSSHQLADFRFCPLYYSQKRAGLIPERRSEDYALGAAAHSLVLEGQKQFEVDYLVGGPINPRTDKPYGEETKVFKDWAAQQTKTVISDDQFALVCQLHAAVVGHEEAAELLRDGVAEGVLRGEQLVGARPAQVRLDWFNPRRGIVDLKTCRSVDDFESDVERFGYVEQMAFYSAAVHWTTNELVPVHLIAVEKTPPYRVGVWQISPLRLEIAARENDRAIRDLYDCDLIHYWPTRYESIRFIS